MTPEFLPQLRRLLIAALRAIETELGIQSSFRPEIGKQKHPENKP